MGPGGSCAVPGQKGRGDIESKRGRPGSTRRVSVEGKGLQGRRLRMSTTVVVIALVAGIGLILLRVLNGGGG